MSELKILKLNEIKKRINLNKVISDQEEGFIAFSKGNAIIPPVGYLHFVKPPGDCHIKYGAIKGDDIFVIKVASGFYDNPKLGIPSSSGVMIALSAKTGEVKALLQDEGHLTDIRTAVAGLIVAKNLAPKRVKAIGIIGSGIQARLQLELLKHFTDCKDVHVWGLHIDEAEVYKKEMEFKGYNVTVAQSVKEVCDNCNLIVTTTPARKFLVNADWIQPGTHITAVGADAEGKQEIDPLVFKKADIRVVDSREQCVDHGETCHAIRKGLVQESDLVELGQIIAGASLGRKDDQQITIADLTGVAVQDIQIVKSVLT